MNDSFIGDSGLDEYSCFFRNLDGSIVQRSSHTSPTYNITKRKVIQYINYMDSTDTAGGHGTHVTGTVAGSCVGIDSTMIKHGGHAPGAKIAFFDMGDSLSPSSIYYPSPLSSVFQVAYNAGAKLHTNSWGGSYNYYTSSEISMDNFHMSNPDFLALFAAGNDGSEGYYSVATPSVSKNCLTVGASMSDASSDIGRVAYFSGLGPTFDGRIKVRWNINLI